MPTASIGPIRSSELANNNKTPKSATQRVYGELREKIIKGTIPPGEKLKIESLKLQLNTGTSPIREALSLLTSDQLVERMDQRGFRAAPANIEHFEEILELRCQLEDIAVRKSIAAAKAAWEEQVVITHHRLVQSDGKPEHEHETLHKAFHMSLINGCGSPILIRFCDQLYDLNIRYRFLAGKSLQYKKRDISAEHQSILNAVLDKNSDLAAEYLVQHYMGTGEFLHHQLDKSLALNS